MIQCNYEQITIYLKLDHRTIEQFKNQEHVILQDEKLKHSSNDGTFFMLYC